MEYKRISRCLSCVHHHLPIFYSKPSTIPTDMFKSLLTLLGVCAVLIGCSEGLTGATEDPVDTSEDLKLSFFEQAQPVTYVTLERSSMGNDALTERQNHVFRDGDDFAAFWRELYSNHSQAPDLPEVDFDEEIVVAVVLGVRTSGGYRVEVKQVAKRDGHLGLHVEETAPGDGCAVYGVITSPYHIVKMAFDAAPVVFADTKTIHSCED